MKIGIIGTRGIPNRFGGFEQFAEKFSEIMVQRGHDITVYAPHDHTYQAKEYRKIKIVHRFNPERWLGSFSQFIYDFNCIRHARNQEFDIILQLGYTSSAVWSWLFPKAAKVVTNMDGLEWSRSKYQPWVQRYLLLAEKWAVKYSDFLIADSIGIQTYLKQKYQVASLFIPYGAEPVDEESIDPELLLKYHLKPFKFDLVIARFEPENNIELILSSYAQSPELKLVLIGDHLRNSFGRKMFETYRHCENINFSGPNYEVAELNSLRSYCRLYIHGHSVGGTNPSLLEAMAGNALVCAHRNQFNSAVLGDDAYYFKDATELLSLILMPVKKEKHITWLTKNQMKIKKIYNWNKIATDLETNFTKWLAKVPEMKVLSIV